MNKDGLPEFEEGSMLPPIILMPQQEELCRRLDALNQRTIHGQELSNLFRGAIFAIREECRSNSDWMAQSAHSLREIICSSIAEIICAILQSMFLYLTQPMMRINMYLQSSL